VQQSVKTRQLHRRTQSLVLIHLRCIGGLAATLPPLENPCILSKVITPSSSHQMTLNSVAILYLQYYGIPEAFTSLISHVKYTANQRWTREGIIMTIEAGKQLWWNYSECATSTRFQLPSVTAQPPIASIPSDGATCVRRQVLVPPNIYSLTCHYHSDYHPTSRCLYRP
jgi:hypothetical protein